MLTLSTPAAPRFRLTAWKACRMNREVIRPVSECTLIFFMASLSRVAITKFGPAGFRGRFLASPRLRLSLGFPARARADQFWVLARELTVHVDSPVVLRLQSVFPFTS